MAYVALRFRDGDYWDMARLALCRGRGPQVDNSFGSWTRGGYLCERGRDGLAPGGASKDIGRSSGDHVDTLFDRARIHRFSTRSGPHLASKPKRTDKYVLKKVKARLLNSNT